MAGCCQHGDEPLCSITDSEFLDQLRDYQLPRELLVIRSLLVLILLGKRFYFAVACFLRNETRDEVK